MKKLKKIVKGSYFYSIWVKFRQANNEKETLRNWRSNGKPVPPPHIYKGLVIKKYANDYRIAVFIETGTYLGETVDFVKRLFRKIFSIELDLKLYQAAKERFAREKNIAIRQGDSGEVIESILSNISEPCIFWLDGHYSEGFTAKGKLNTPILAELGHIFAHSNQDHVILIDDARCFDGLNDYPTLDVLKQFVVNKRPNFQFYVEDDIIRIHK